MVSNQTALLNGGFAPEVSQWQLWVDRVVLTVISSLPVCPGSGQVQAPLAHSHLCHVRK